MPVFIGGNIFDINDLSKKDIQIEQNILPNLENVIEPELIETIIETIIEPVIIEPELIEKFVPQKKVKFAHPRTHSNTEDNLVIVNGKVKKIGKQSKYLLDMLTIDD
jgi:hypothetical protein